MINWAKLKAQNRVKDIGIPWTEVEARAVFKLRIPADYVRKGVLTVKEYNKVKREPIKTKEEIVQEAEKLGVNFVPEVIDKDVLEREIERKKQEPEEEPKEDTEEEIEEEVEDKKVDKIKLK